MKTEQLPEPGAKSRWYSKILTFKKHHILLMVGRNRSRRQWTGLRSMFTSVRVTTAGHSLGANWLEGEAASTAGDDPAVASKKRNFKTVIVSVLFSCSQHIQHPVPHKSTKREKEESTYDSKLLCSAAKCMLLDTNSSAEMQVFLNFAYAGRN